jgi:large subunit GTPase 1
MAVASMSNRTFTAERGQVSFVAEGDSALPGLRGGGGGGGAASAAAALQGGRGGTVHDLSIPRRPVWDGEITGAELQGLEKQAFLAWRREVAVAELAHGGGPEGAEAGVAAVTPFEKNIDVWRQLWRVVERCDVLIQIVDSRNPLLYRCPDLENYVREVNPSKRCLLLLNKADFLSLAQRIAWAKYLSSQGLQFAFFSARAENAALEELDRIQQGRAPLASAATEKWPSALYSVAPPAEAATGKLFEALEDSGDEEEEEEAEEEEEEEGGWGKVKWWG